MIDIKFLRQNPDVVKENIKKKFQDEKLPLVDEVIALDEELRKTMAQADQLRAQRNTMSSQIGALMREKKIEEANKVKQEVADIAKMLPELEAKETELQAKIKKGPIPPELRALTTILFVIVVIAVIGISIYRHNQAKKVRVRRGF